MISDCTGQNYYSIAHLWQKAELQSNGIAAHERALAFLNRTGGRALDIGCGSSGRFIELLIQHGYAVEGLDVSTQMVELARQRHPEVTFHLADICAWPFPHRYDFITAWDSIWHVPLIDHSAMLRRICGALEDGGIFIFTTGGTDEPDEHHDSSMGPTLRYATLGISQTLDVLHQSGCVCRHLEYDQWSERHLVVIAQKRATA